MSTKRWKHLVFYANTDRRPRMPHPIVIFSTGRGVLMVKNCPEYLMCCHDKHKQRA